jgi:hypothetical protein
MRKTNVMLGNIMGNIGMKDKAIKEYNEALKLNPTNSEAKNRLSKLSLD